MNQLFHPTGLFFFFFLYHVHYWIKLVKLILLSTKREKFDSWYHSLKFYIHDVLFSSFAASSYLWFSFEDKLLHDKAPYKIKGGLTSNWIFAFYSLSLTSFVKRCDLCLNAGCLNCRRGITRSNFFQNFEDSLNPYIIVLIH